MKIRSVALNNRKKAFEIKTARQTLAFPYVKADPKPSSGDPVIAVNVDKELSGEGFVYRLQSGREGVIHIDQVLDYNQDPSYMRNLLVYQLTLQANQQINASPLSKREIVRRLGTSATQLYRLLDTTNYTKTIDQLLALLHILDCKVELKVESRRSGRAA